MANNLNFLKSFFNRPEDDKANIALERVNESFQITNSLQAQINSLVGNIDTLQTNFEVSEQSIKSSFLDLQNSFNVLSDSVDIISDELNAITDIFLRMSEKEAQLLKSETLKTFKQEDLLQKQKKKKGILGKLSDFGKLSKLRERKTNSLLDDLVGLLGLGIFGGGAVIGAVNPIKEFFSKWDDRITGGGSFETFDRQLREETVEKGLDVKNMDTGALVLDDDGKPIRVKMWEGDTGAEGDDKYGSLMGRPINLAAGDKGKNMSAEINLTNELHRKWIINHFGQEKLTSLDNAYESYKSRMTEKNKVKDTMHSRQSEVAKEIRLEYKEQIKSAPTFKERRLLEKERDEKRRFDHDDTW